MYSIKESFQQEQEEIQQTLLNAFRFIEANKMDLLEVLTEPQADNYLAILYWKSFFYMQKGLHRNPRKGEICH
jgi:hypothetical protein